MTIGALPINDPSSVLEVIGKLLIWILPGIVAVAILSLLLLFIVCLCERQYLAGNLSAGEPYPYPPSPYWRVTRETARVLGLLHAGDFATKPGTSTGKALLSLFLSQDRQVLAAIISGATIGLKVRKTSLQSRLPTGRVLASDDSPGMDDLSGVTDRAVLLNAGIQELMEFHRKRILQSGILPVAFNLQNALQDFEKMRLERGERWVQMGLARWADPRQSSIRMTIRGTLAHLGKTFSQKNKLQGQQHRTSIPRAGAE